MKKYLCALAVFLALPVGWAFGQTPAPAAAAGTVTIQNFTDIVPNDGKNNGTFQDTNGSKITLEVKGKAPKTFLVLNYTMVQGGYCGLWCRAGGSDWNGVNLSTAKAISVAVFGKDSVVLGLALKDKNNNQYVAQLPSTKGGKWETVSVPMASFNLDPYYTPPDAIKGAPKDFSLVKTFNIQPQTVGTVNVAVNNIVAQ
jgi:hypothetical protein